MLNCHIYTCSKLSSYPIATKTPLFVSKPLDATCKTHNWAGPPNRRIPTTGRIPKTRPKFRHDSHKWAGFPRNWAENTTGPIPTTGLKILWLSLTNGPILR